VTGWTAIWAPGPGRLRWELTIADEAGNVAMRERSHALFASPRPGDGVLVTLSLCPAGDWEPGEGGTFSCPVIVTSRSREAALVSALLAAGRSDPVRRVRLRPIHML
jgi:hypothetical protein